MEFYQSRGPSPRPCSSVYSNQFSMEDLIHHISQTQRLEELVKENHRFQKEHALHRRLWIGTICVINMALEGMVIIKEALRDFNAMKASGERDWLAHWGIFIESIDGVGSNPPLWI